jgi:Holliday junction resolvase-like predicted endonuclease
MNDPSALRADAIERAARVIKAAKLQVLDRDWSSGGHHLDLVTTPGSDILAVLVVRAAKPGGARASLTVLSEAGFREATDALRAWMRERGTVYHDLWVVTVTVDPVTGVEVSLGNAAEVG